MAKQVIDGEFSLPSELILTDDDYCQGDGGKLKKRVVKEKDGYSLPSEFPYDDYQGNSIPMTLPRNPMKEEGMVVLTSSPQSPLSRLRWWSTPTLRSLDKPSLKIPSPPSPIGYHPNNDPAGDINPSSTVYRSNPRFVKQDLFHEMKQQQLKNIHKQIHWQDKISSNGRSSFWPSQQGNQGAIIHDEDGENKKKKKSCAGTGVFLPRKARTPSPPKRYPFQKTKPVIKTPPSSFSGGPTSSVPKRGGQALKLDAEGMIGAKPIYSTTDQQKNQKYPKQGKEKKEWKPSSAKSTAALAAAREEEECLKQFNLPSDWTY